ncbi:MAG: kinase/pyrophosphorylase, partial [Pseudomonadota bacterium]
MDERMVFFISDQTGVTAETLGHSLLTQFNGQDFRQVTLPFIDNEDKAREAVERINRSAVEEEQRPIVFSTLVQDELRRIIRKVDGLHLDIFDAF